MGVQVDLRRGEAWKSEDVDSRSRGTLHLQRRTRDSGMNMFIVRRE